MGRPAATVRGWLRRFASRAGALRSAFTRLLREVDTDTLMPGPAGSPLADAVAAVLAAAVAVAPVAAGGVHGVAVEAGSYQAPI